MTFTFPDYMVGRRRLVFSTDTKNEADDQYAVVHALLSPILDVRGIMPAHFGTDRGRASMQQSRAEIDLLLNLMQMTGRLPVADGSPVALVDEQTTQDSRGARLILEEARRGDGTLFVVAIGPLTDVVSAILLDRKLIEQHVIVVWVGGAPYGERIPVYSPEYDLANDVAAAQVVFGSDVELWQVAMSTYTQMSVGHHELRQRVAPHGAIGKYLVDQLLEFSERAPIRLESHSLGDTPAI
jgi:purine nucleosidase